jgi:hypothetical protein
MIIIRKGFGNHQPRHNGRIKNPRPNEPDEHPFNYSPLVLVDSTALLVIKLFHGYH